MDDEGVLTEKMRKNMGGQFIGLEAIVDRFVAKVPLLGETVALVVAWKPLKNFTVTPVGGNQIGLTAVLYPKGLSRC